MATTAQSRPHTAPAILLAAAQALSSDSPHFHSLDLHVTGLLGGLVHGGGVSPTAIGGAQRMLFLGQVRDKLYHALPCTLARSPPHTHFPSCTLPHTLLRALPLRAAAPTLDLLTLLQQVEGAPRSCEEAKEAQRGWLMGQLSPLVPASRVCDDEEVRMRRQLRGGHQSGSGGQASEPRQLQGSRDGQPGAEGQPGNSGEVSDTRDTLTDTISVASNNSVANEATANTVTVRFIVAQMTDTIYGILVIQGIVVFVHYLVLLFWACCKNRRRN